MMETSVGILGLGLYLPAEVRGNEYWPPSVVARWRAQPPPPPLPRAPASDGVARVLRALSEQTADAFRGAVERRVMAEDMTVLEMAVEAGRAALARAELAPDAIDLLLTHTVVPDALIGNVACQVHHRLGLPARCFAIETDAAANSFLMQLTMAEAMIASGRARNALLVQSSAASRLIDLEDPLSPLFGDGASAVVVGPVTAGRGITTAVHFADGRYPRTLVAGLRGRPWYEDGRATLHVEDAGQMNEVFLLTVDCCKQSVDAALAASGLNAADIDYFAMYQGTPWLRRVVQEAVGLTHARSIDTFADTGYLFAAILPTSMYFAERAGLLATDDQVMITGGGPGMTYSSIVLRWGR